MEKQEQLTIELNDENKSYHTILNHKEYIIKFENIDYNLRVEIDNQNIYFILTNLKDKLTYNYKNKMDKNSIIDKLELNPSKYSNLEVILNIFDSIYKKNQISIEKNDENSYNLLIKILNPFDEEIINKIKLYKKYFNDTDKYNYLLSKIELIQNWNNNLRDNEEVIDLKNKVNKLNNDLIQKDNVIKEMKENIKNIEKKLKDDFNNKMNDFKNSLINEINKQNEIIKYQINNLEENINRNKQNEDIKIIKNEIKEINNILIKNNNNIKDIENNIKENEIIIKNINEELNKEKENNENKKLIEEIFENINDINNKYKNDQEITIKEINNKMNEKENNINIKINNFTDDFNNKLKDKIDSDKIKEINDCINIKYNELKELINKIYLHNDYIQKINYKFKKEPQKLKYKLDITNTNTSSGWNDRFEVFISYKDNKEYLISPNINDFNLDIFTLLDNQKIKSLQGHKKTVSTIRYFINKNQNNYNCNEYLVSGDDNKIVIIWDITNNYNIKYQIDTKYGDIIYSCLLIFPHNIDDNYIITSTYNQTDDNDKSATKIYSLNNGQFIKYIKNTNNTVIYYLLSWYNKKNNKYYIIQFSYLKIIINNLLEDELYSELKQEPETDHFSGFIYNKDNNDYLCSSSFNGYINIWDLYNKKIFKIINTNKCKLAHIIQWNEKYIIVADVNNKSFKIIDLEENKIISDIGGQHTDEVKCIKKVYHPIYGESLLSSSDDKTIKLWTI